MSLLRRVRDLSAATLNDRLEKAEDPVKLIDRFLHTTREEIAQAERLYQQCSAHNMQLRGHWLQAEQQSEQREQQATNALRIGAEDAARAALLDKTSHDERAKQYKQLYEQSLETLSELQSQLAQLTSEFRSVADKREYYVARMESLRLRQQLGEAAGRGFGFGGTHSSVFRRLEDRIGDMELEAQSLSELRRGTAFRAESSFPKNSAVVESELESMKQRLQSERGGLTSEETVSVQNK